MFTEEHHRGNRVHEGRRVTSFLYLANVGDSAIVARVSLLVTALLVFASLAFALQFSSESDSSRPDPGFGTRAARLEAAPAGTEPLRRRAVDLPRFMEHQRDEITPIRWDPCRPINYVVNMTNAPENSLAVIRRAFVKASEGTGYRFEFAGVTDETFDVNSDRKYLPQVYGDRWSPVLVDWAQYLRNETGDTVFGQAAPEAVVREDGTSAWVTGHLTLNADVFDAWINVETATSRKEEGVVLHEIGHILGIGHLDDSFALMNATFSGRYGEFMPADLDALHAVASGPCMPDL